MRRVCEEGLRKRYGEPKEVHIKRLNHELNVISRMGFSDYFLIVWDFMKYAHENHILTGIRSWIGDWFTRFIRIRNYRY